MHHLMPRGATSSRSRAPTTRPAAAAAARARRRRRRRARAAAQQRRAARAPQCFVHGNGNSMKVKANGRTARDDGGCRPEGGRERSERERAPTGGARGASARAPAGVRSRGRRVPSAPAARTPRWTPHPPPPPPPSPPPPSRVPPGEAAPARSAHCARTQTRPRRALASAPSAPERTLASAPRRRAAATVPCPVRRAVVAVQARPQRDRGRRAWSPRAACDVSSTTPAERADDRALGARCAVLLRHVRGCPPSPRFSRANAASAIASVEAACA